MHLLEIAGTQPALGNHLGIVRAQASFHGKPLSRPSFYGNKDRINRLSSWKLFGFNSGGHHERQRGMLVISAVAILEPKRLLKKKADSRSGLNGLKLSSDKVAPSSVQTRKLNEDSEDMDEKEKLRRMRISKANKGNTPWNKGRKHSPETLQRIRERTRLAMQDPKVKMKLVNLGHSQSQETRIKIGVGVRMGWKKRRKKLLLQETCFFEWQNLIAEASRRGYDGEAELEWESYDILNEQLKMEWLESIEKRKTMPRPKGSKRAHKSPEQRRKISEAISRKWADSAYRERVVSALFKYHGIEPGSERTPRRKPSSNTGSARRSSENNKEASNGTLSSSTSDLKFPTVRPKVRRRYSPSYKDPLASSKLEMLKNIRAQRASMETKKIEAVERARLLIAEAEKAAMALEVAAAKSPVARASLMETRKLIAEAIRSIESIEIEQVSPQEDGEDLLSVEDESDEDEDEVVPLKVNGTRTLASLSGQEGLDFGDLDLQEILNGEEKEGFGFDDLNLLESLNGEEKDGFGFDDPNLQESLNGDDGLFPASPNGYGLSTISHERRNDNGQLEWNNERQEKALNDNGQLEWNNGREVKPLIGEAEEEEAPVKLVTVTKKWVRGRLVEVASGAA